MGIIKFESLKPSDSGYKIFFTSYLREDFIEKSVVISLDKNFTISNIYITSYKFGSVEWINGYGLSECRQWETDEQAESLSYLTRRYTMRISNGYAPEGHAENLLIPDVLECFDNSDIATLLKTIIYRKKTRKKLVPEKYNLVIQ